MKGKLKMKCLWSFIKLECYVICRILDRCTNSAPCNFLEFQFQMYGVSSFKITKCYVTI